MSTFTAEPVAAPGRNPARAAALLLALVALLAGLSLARPAGADARTYTGISVTADGDAYVLMSDAGEAYAFGLPYRGNPVGFSGRIVSVATTADGSGYAAVSSTGQVYAYGTVAYHGNPAGFSGEIAGIDVTADGSGYVVASTHGQVYAYNVAYHGNAVGFSGRITGVSLTASGAGYVLVSSAGQVYAFNAGYHGNPVGFSGEIVAVSVNGDGSGYYAMSSTGQVYAYGTQYHGNPTGFTGRMVGISARADGGGYIALSSSGQVYAYGVAYHGNGTPPSAPGAGASAQLPAGAGPASWSDGPVDAPAWRTAMRSHSSIACGSRSIPAALEPQSVRRGWTARAQAIVDVIRSPLFSFRNVGGAAEGGRSGHVSDSYHYCGRAIDAFAPGVRINTRASGDALRASWRLANWAAHNASKLNVSQVIFYDRIWTARRGGWRRYRHPSGKNTNVLQHRDHVHISVY